MSTSAGNCGQRQRSGGIRQGCMMALNQHGVGWETKAEVPLTTEPV
ncbi:hypothetical protein [Escherichia coli]|nr:hypothetical protein [Escherichia coli]